MSKNIVDSIIELNSPYIGLLPSRRQIDYCVGYVNNWTTKTFVEYVKNKNQIIIERDHGGIGQSESDYMESFKMDAINVDIVHIDPWKHYKDFNTGLNETIENIKFLYGLNQNLKYEIGTEEAIRKFSSDELNTFLKTLKLKLNSKQFDNIIYVCIQSGRLIDWKNSDDL